MFDYNFVLDEMPMQEDFVHPDGRFEFDIVDVKLREVDFATGQEMVIDLKMKSEKGYFTDSMRINAYDLTARRMALERFGDYMFASGVESIDLKGKTENESLQILKDVFMMKHLIIIVKSTSKGDKTFINAKQIFNSDGISRKYAKRASK